MSRLQRDEVVWWQKKHNDSPEFPRSVDLTAFGTTRILFRNDEEAGHWRLHGQSVTMGELFLQFGEKSNAQELMHWWCHAYKVCTKREHPKGSAEIQAASR